MPVTPDSIPLQPSARSSGAYPLLTAAGLLALAAPAVAWQEPVPEEPVLEEPVAPPEEVAADPVAEEAAPEPELELPEVEADSIPLDGLLWMRARSRWSSTQEDSDLFATLRLNIGDVDKLGYGAHIAAVGLADLDGSETGEFDFYGVYDTYDERVRTRLNLAYLDLPMNGELDVLRFGRQQMYTTPEFVWFDGLRIEHGDRSQREPVVGAFAGLPVRPYRSTSGGDMVKGAFIEATPWWHGRVRLDYMRFEDESRIGLGGNDLWNLDLRQELVPGVDVEGSYSRLDSEDRDMELGLTSYGLGQDLILRLTYFELLEPQGTLANELDPFSSTTISLEPYKQTRILASKGIGEELVLEVGADVRRVTEELGVGEFNRDFERYFLRTTWLDAFGTGFDATLTGEAWRADASDIETWGIDLEKELGDRTELSLGSYYSLYKYDLFLDAERDDVRSYHADLSYDWREDLRVNVDYVYEDDDLDDQHTIRLGVRWSF